MNRWTEGDVKTYMAKHKAEEEPEEPESKLQSKIKKDCEERGFPCLCFPQTPKVKRFLPPGWPD